MAAPKSEGIRLGPSFECLVAHLDPGERTAFEGSLRPLSLPAGARLASAGEHADRMVFLATGRVGVTLGGPDAVVEVGTKGPGDWVGEMALVHPAPSIATVTALEPVTGLSLDHGGYARLRERHPAAAGQLLCGICCDLARRLRRSGQVRLEVREGRAAALPQLRALHGVERAEVSCEWVPAGSSKHRVRSHDPAALVATLEKVGAFRRAAAEDATYVEGLRRDLAGLAKVMELETFLDGETVIQGGSRTDGVYVILAGRLRVRTPEGVSDVHVDREMGPGEVVGLVSFFDEGTRAATCTAVGATVLAVLYAASVQEILRQGARGAPMGVNVLDWFARQLVEDARALDAHIVARMRAEPGARAAD